MTTPARLVTRVVVAARVFVGTVPGFVVATTDFVVGTAMIVVSPAMAVACRLLRIVGGVSEKVRIFIP
jgi:hypothetical protein